MLETVIEFKMHVYLLHYYRFTSSFRKFNPFSNSLRPFVQPLMNGASIVCETVTDHRNLFRPWFNSINVTRCFHDCDRFVFRSDKSRQVIFQSCDKIRTCLGDKTSAVVPTTRGNLRARRADPCYLIGDWSWRSIWSLNWTPKALGDQTAQMCSAHARVVLDS